MNSGKIRAFMVRAAAVIIAVGLSVTTFAQNTIKVAGTVRDEAGEPIIGASVMVKGATIGVPTGLDGEYEISVPSNAVLEFSSLGLVTVEEAVKGRTVINIVLKEDNTFLESVVVVGYGTQRKGSVTGAISGIGSDDLIKTKTENPQNMLTGRVPGLRVWQKSAEPGAYASNIDIRGMGSAMVVIDGVPRSIDDFNRINPSDIENVSVLKDASAAIYGVRGGNGVILVTTKKGSGEKISVNYDGAFVFQTPSRMPALAEVQGTIDLYNERALNTVSGTGSIIYSPEVAAEYADGTRESGDWNNDVLAKMAPQTQHNLSVSGGTEKIQYYVSMGYIYQEGFFKSGDLNYSKYNLRSNVTAQILKGLKLDVNLAALSDTQNNPYTSSVNIIRNYWSRGVLYPAYADKEHTMLNYNGLDLDENAVAMMTSDVSGYRQYKKKQLQASGALNFDFGEHVDALKGLSAKALYSYDFRYDNNETFRKEYYLYMNNGDGTYTQKLFANSSPNKLEKAAYDRKQSLMQFMLNYNRKFGKHDVGALVGWEAQRLVGENFNASGELMFSNPYFTALTKDNQQVGIDAGTGSFYDMSYEALISRLNYSYDDRYLIEAQFRYDGSSKFAKGHQWGFFPSVSAAWRISQEPWFKNSGANFINQLKIRASYGVLGDDGSVNYEWQTGYTYRGGETSSNGWYNGYVPGYIFDGNFVYTADPQPLPNTNITWLRSKTFNIGVDFEAWNGLLGITADYFQRNRSGLFAQNSNSLPTVVGAEPPMENLESDKNLGLELQITHRNKVGDFSYNLSGIVTVTRKIYGTSVRNGNYGNSYDRWRHDNLNNRYQGVQFGYEAAGRFENWDDIWNYAIEHGNSTLPGDYKYLDWNGDGEINSLDEHPYAFDQTPWMNYSLSFACAWKNIDFSLLFQGSAMGSMSYQEPLYSIWGQNGGGALEQYLDRWHPVGEWTDPYDQSLEWVSGYYGLTGHYPYANSSFNRVSTAFLRLKQIEIGYTLPKFKSPTMKDFRLRIYANAYNPLTITKVKFVDPEHPDDELGRLYPLNKTFTLGLNLSF